MAKADPNKRGIISLVVLTDWERKFFYTARHAMGPFWHARCSAGSLQRGRMKEWSPSFQLCRQKQKVTLKNEKEPLSSDSLIAALRGKISPFRKMLSSLKCQHRRLLLQPTVLWLITEITVAFLFSLIQWYSAISFCFWMQIVPLIFVFGRREIKGSSHSVWKLHWREN